MEPELALPSFGNGRFRSRALVGQGGMGVVYLVHDAEMDCDVALKTLRTSKADEIYLLKREFRALAGITHRNLVPLYELFAEPDSTFFTMEFIDGVDFSGHVRADGAVHWPKLCDATRQLVVGLTALHAAGKVHRDVKPTNIRVTHDHRVVLLDFGLWAALGVDATRDPDSSGGGTLAYMAPEQAWGQTPPAAASDWYSVGTLLFEAVTGELPFHGPPALLLTAKLRPPRPRARAPQLSAELDALIFAMLSPDPLDRPQAADILEVLRRQAGGSAPASIETGPAPLPFVGRARELARLEAALERDGQRPVVVEISGPSGIGKSELVRRFVQQLEAEVCVLAGRCHPQETVPYNAIDPIIDALSRQTLLEKGDLRERMTPESAAALVRVFPVLGRVPALASRGEEPPAGEPLELRRRAFAALREVLAWVAERQRLVVWIDDAQGADSDSATLLREILRAAEAPPFLLLLSHRDRGDGALFRALDDAGIARERLEIGVLDAGDTRALIGSLCAHLPDREAWIERIAAESAGSPFLAGELARRAISSAPGVESAATATLADVIEARLAQLEPSLRRVVELLAVSRRPLERSVALAASGIGERGRPTLVALANACLLRPTTSGDAPAVEIYHDRIGEALLAGLSAMHLAERHGALAEALAVRPTHDPEQMLYHCLGAGRPTQAAPWAVRAADRAGEALAFARAAQLYRQALELHDESARPLLLPKLAESLANAGHGREAAETFEAAAAVLADGPRDRWLDLRRRAAEHYIRTGHLEQGLAATGEVLRQVGFPFPASAGDALRSALRARFRLAWRGLRHRLRAEPLDADRQLRLDAAWGAAIGISLMDQIRAEAIGSQYLVEALECGDAGHILRGLGSEAAKCAQFGGQFIRRRCTRILATMQDIAAQDRPYEQAFLHIVRGATVYQSALWRQTQESCDAGVAILRAQCRGVTWEISTGEAFALSALAHMGRLGELARRLPVALAEVEDRDDLYAEIGFRAGILGLHWLALDRVDEGWREADEAMQRWPATEEFHVQHYLHLIAGVHADLYRGEAWAAWRRIHEAWPRLQKALLLAMEAPRVELRNLRARAALAAAAEGSEVDGWNRRKLLALVRSEAKRIRRNRDLASAAPFAELLEAGADEVAGSLDSANRRYSAAATGFDAAEMQLYAAAARRRQGTLLGGESGAALRAESDAWMASQGVRDAPALARVCCPAGVSGSRA